MIEEAREILARQFDGHNRYAGTAIDIRRGSFVGIPAERAVAAITQAQAEAYERAAKACEKMGEGQWEREKGYRAAGNPGPYFSSSQPHDCARAIRALSKQPESAG